MSASSKKKLRKEQATESLTEKQLAEKKEARKTKTITITFVVIMVLVVVIALGTVIGRQVSNSGILDRSTTAVTLGNHTISSAELSYFYIDAINSTYNSWYQSYGTYASYYMQMFLGLDLTQPLSSQTYDETTGESWADFFVETAIENAKSVYALCDEAAAKGYTLTEADRTSIDSAISNLRNYTAVYYGYSDLISYLKGLYGNGATEDSFRAYYEATTLATSYQTAYSDSLTYDDAAIRAYDAEHALDYNAYSYASYYLAASSFLEGGTEDEDGTVTYSDEEKAASVVSAKAAADSLLGVESLEQFDEAIAGLSINADNDAATSTKYADYLYANINTTFQDWVTDANRKAGDMTVIANSSTSTAEDGTETTTTLGYYVLFFENSTDNVFPLANVRHILVSFEGGTTDDSGNTVYSDEEKQAALDEAQAILEQWQDGDATEESFAALANEKSTDPGSNTNGGLYEDIYPGQMVTAFNDWCFDDSRQSGDTGIVETTYGYHVMYYVGDSDITYRDFMITNQLRSDDLNAWFTALLEAVPVTEGNTSRLNRDIVLASAS